MGDGIQPKPHGKPTPAQQVSAALTRAGYGKQLVRKNVGYGGHLCSWDETNGVTRIRYQTRDVTPEDAEEAEREEMLALYIAALEAVGYAPKREGYYLLVAPKTAPKKARAKKAADAEPEPVVPAEPEPPFPGAKPVRHDVTKKLVGWLGPDKFIPVD